MEDFICIISDMFDEGISFDEIEEYLRAEGLPDEIIETLLDNAIEALTE